MSFKTIIKSTACAALLSSIAVAHAQDEGEEENAIDRVLGTVTVTATKKADVEDIQTVPVSVTAFNADTLDALKVRDLQSLSFSTPNVSLDEINTSRGTANFSIRGLGVNSSIPSIDPTVGVFIDGVYLGTNNGVVFDVFDLDSIEILRGPQGLLFGRNTTGGAVVVNTGNPTDEFSYKFRAAVDGPVDEDRGGPNGTIQAIVSGPLIEDRLNGKVGVYYNDDTGYFKNLYDGDNHGEAQTWIYRGALEYFASPELTVLGKLEYSDSRGDGPSAQNRGTYSRDTFDLSIDEPGEYTAETLFGSLRTDYDVSFGNGTVTNIFGYRDYSGTTSGDIDALPVFIFHSDTELEQEQISNELRYAGTFENMDVTTGLYYFNQDVAYTEIRLFGAGNNYGGGEQDHTVFGAFGQVNYDLTENLTLIGGLRYSNEEKDAKLYYINARAECSVVSGTCAPDIEDSDDWSNWTPKLGFQYFAGDATQVYGNYTKGFRSGGYNFRITDQEAFEALVEQTGSVAFDEEEVDSYEIGIKHETADGRARINAVAFFTEIQDMQREVNEAVISGVAQTILNTANAEIQGIELEGRVVVTDSLLLTGNIGLIDAKYTEVFSDISGDGVIDATDLGLAVPRVPETTFGFGFIHDTNLGRYGSLVARADYQNRDEVAYTDNNYGWIQAAEMVNADLTWNTPVDGLSLSLYGKNLLDEVQAGGDTQLGLGFGGPLSTGEAEPFGDPANGSFSPLKKGRVVGFELTLSR